MQLKEQITTTLSFAGRLLWDGLAAIGSPRRTFNEAFNSKESFHDTDGRKHYTWRAVRRQNLNDLTWDICKITYFVTMGLLLHSEQHEMTMYHVATHQSIDNEINCGISYNLGMFLVWLLALFALLGDALFKYYPKSLVSCSASIFPEGDKNFVLPPGDSAI